MFDDLQTCYNLKVATPDAYSKISATEQNNLCLKLRQNITEYLSSDSVLFENHLNLEIENIKSKN